MFRRASLFIGTSCTVAVFTIFATSNVDSIQYCMYSTQNIFNAKNFNPHKKLISLLNVPICTQGIQLVARSRYYHCHWTLLYKPVQDYCQLDLQQQTSMKFELEFDHFHSRECIWKCRLPEWRLFWPEGDEFTNFDPRLQQQIWYCLKTFLSSWGQISNILCCFSCGWRY